MPKAVEQVHGKDINFIRIKVSDGDEPQMLVRKSDRVMMTRRDGQPCYVRADQVKKYLYDYEFKLGYYNPEGDYLYGVTKALFDDAIGDVVEVGLKTRKKAVKQTKSSANA